MVNDIENREALRERKLPRMQLCSGSSGLPPRLPTSSEQDAAKRRFAVRGNAVVTGGAGTLALEGARALLEHGLSGVALFDLNPSSASESISTLQKDFPNAVVISKKVDVTNAGTINLAVIEVAKELGSVDIMCCFAGIVGCSHAIDVDPTEFRRILDINTTGAFLCAQAGAKQMVAQGTGGSIVLIASISGHIVNYPQPQVAYNVSKSALLHMKNCLAAEWARYGIRTNTISPGYMDTILNEGSGLEEARNIWSERNPMGRMGQPKELTGPLVLLCSNAGSYMNGADLVVDGGATVF